MKLTNEQELEAIEFWGEVSLWINDDGYPSFIDSKNGIGGRVILWEMGESGWNAYAVTGSGRGEQLYEGMENKVPDFDEILDVRTRGTEDDDCEDEGIEYLNHFFYDDGIQEAQ